MKNNMLFILILSIFLNGSALAKNKTNLCGKEEDVYFNCLLENNKIVSICAKNNVNPNEGYVYYRYGSKKFLDLVFPNGNIPPKEIFTRTDVSRLSDGRGIHLKFKKYNYQYVISNALVPGEVYVVKDKKIVFNKVCKGSEYIPFSLKIDNGISNAVEDESDDLDKH